MAWEEGFHCKPIVKKASDSLRELKGTLTSEESRTWFTKFCMNNLYFTVKLLIGVKLAPVQEVILKAFLQRDFSLQVAGRGFSKSFIIAIFIILYAIFNPGCKIVLTSAGFRQSKMIYKQMEKFMQSDEGKFFKDCVVGKPGHSNDGYEMQIGTSWVIAVPLTDKIRGLRANVVIIDELLLMPPEIMNTVITPFLSVKQGGLENQELYEAESVLIKHGVLKEEDRTQFKNNKLIGLSSASLKCESLYKDWYVPYLTKIMDDKATDVNHVVMKFSYEAAPAGLLDLKLIKNAEMTSSRSAFNREFRAMFTDDGGGYFSMETLNAATIPITGSPKIKLRGDPKKNYILSLDPNNSEAEHSDNFSMTILELDEENKAGIVVHVYALAKSTLTNKSKYLRYILKYFNIVFIIGDIAGSWRFIDEADQFLGGLEQFIGKKIQKIEGDFDDGEEGLEACRKSYNFVGGRIFYEQAFGKANWIPSANENLLYLLEQKRILFGSQIFNEPDVEFCKKQDIPISELEWGLDIDRSVPETAQKEEFAAALNQKVEGTKREMILIENKSNISGNQTFDLPQNLKNNRYDPKRARRDSYTSLLLGAWGMKCYYEMAQAPVKKQSIPMPFWAVR